MVNSSYFIIAIANNFDILQLKKDDAYFLRRVGLSNRLTAAILKDFRLENMECSKYQLIFVTAEEVLSKPILFCLKIKKNCFTFSLIGSTCVCFCRMTMLPNFNLNHFDWLPTHFRKCSDAQLLRGCFAFQQPLRVGVFSPFPRPLPPQSTLTPNQIAWSIKRSRACNVSRLTLIRRLHSRLSPFHRALLYNLCPKQLLSRVMPIKPLQYNNFDLFKTQNYPSFLLNSPLVSKFRLFLPISQGPNDSFSERPN